LDVEELASAYWRKRRALRVEMGSIRLDLDMIRAERSRKRESSVQIDKLSLDLGATKEQLLATPPEGIYSLLSVVNKLEAEIRNNSWSHSTLSELEHFGIRLTGGVTKEQIIDRLASLKAELTARRRVAVQMDSMHLEAQIAAGALPSTEVTTKIVRYTTAIDRRIEQIRDRLEKSAERRRN